MGVGMLNFPFLNQIMRDENVPGIQFDWLGNVCVWYKLFKLLPLTDWARAPLLLPIKTLSSWKSHQPRSGGHWEYSQLDKIIKWSRGVNTIDPANTILIQNMWPTPSSNGKYSNCTFLQSFVRSSWSPSNGRCWLTIELFCQYIVKRLQICSNIKGSTLHTFLTRLIMFSWFEDLSNQIHTLFSFKSRRLLFCKCGNSCP